MNETYDYLTLRVDGGAVPNVVRHLTTTGQARIQEAGGILGGVWIGGPGVGWATDELVALVGWPDRPGDAGALHTDVSGVAGIDAERLTATVRPKAPGVLAPGGVTAHRWFEVDTADWDEFLELSEAAWPTFESLYDNEILGLFRASDDRRSGAARALLLTRYASLAEWERSRQATGATEGEGAEAGRRFTRRRALTRRSIVRIAPLAG